MTDYMVYEAGRLGDELHPEPEFDKNGLPIIPEYVQKKAKELAKLWNAQPTVYTDENVFDVDDDDDDFE